MFDRRFVLAAAILLIGALALAACGGSGVTTTVEVTEPAGTEAQPTEEASDVASDTIVVCQIPCMALSAV
jgi:hypothetical protein